MRREQRGDVGKTNFVGHLMVHRSPVWLPGEPVVKLSARIEQLAGTASGKGAHHASRNRCSPSEPDWHVANMPTAAAVVTAVAIQPSVFSHGLRTNSPMTSRREAMCMIMTIIGTAATPLTTALQNSALTGSSGEKLRSAPTTTVADANREEQGRQDC